MNFIKTFLAGLLAVVVGTFLVFFLWIFILLGIAGSMEKSVAVHPESILKIDFSEVLTDAPSSDPLAGLDLMTLQTQRQLPLLKALRALEAARDDDRIKGIYLRMNGTGGVTGSAILEELREALVEFKQSGKFIVAYNETYSQGGYYLASVADKIYMQPEGMMEWAGLSMNLMFYKGLLDKLDLKAEVFRPTACKYKSAVEPYIYDKMSDANREQMQQLVSSMWGVIAESVAEARGIELKTLNEMADRLEVALPDEALEKGLVDSLIYEDQMEDVFAELGVSDDYDFVTLGDYADVAVRGGFYTLGSWEASAASRYIKRYKYSGSFNMQYSNVKTGEKGEDDYIKQSNFRIQWTHSQDPKANPGSTFSASVNFATSGYSRYSATNLNDILSTQTNSTVSYSKNWAGTPFSLSANMAISQNSQNKTISITLPTMVFNVSRFYPFKRKEKQGKDRWYEKISMQYTGKMTNSVTTTESEVFSKETLENMKNGIEHSIPISASFNLLNYINLSPSVNYNEKWYFKKVEFEWNPVTNQTDTLPTNYGFYRLYNYNFSVSASTTVYGMYDFTKKSRDRKIQAIRHTLTPSIGFSYAPDFSDPKYGYYQTRQTDSPGLSLIHI